jgi:hypothetical protein
MRTALTIVWLGMAGAQTLAPQQLTYTGGVSYFNGDYVFDRRTHAFYFSNGLRVGFGPVDIAGSIPMVVDNGGVVTPVAGGVPVPTGGDDHDAVAGHGSRDVIRTRRGHGGATPGDPTMVEFREGFRTQMGDPLMNASVEVHSALSGFVRSVRVGGSAKAPLRGLGSGPSSGEWDWSLGGSALAAAGRVLLLVDAAYWWIGDLPGLELRDGVSYAAGASISAFAGDGSVMLLLSGMSRIIDSMDPPLSLLASVGHSVGRRGFGTAGLGVGLTDSAPTVSALLGWSVRLRD